MANKYVKYTNLTEQKFRQFLKLYAAGLNAVQISSITEINRNTVNKYIAQIRLTLAECNESEVRTAINFKIKVKQDKVKIITILEEEQTQAHLEDANKCSAIIDLNNLSLMFSKGCLLEQMEHKCKINSFWSYYKTKHATARGLDKARAYYHLNEAAYHYNNQDVKVYTGLLTTLRKRPLYS